MVQLFIALLLFTFFGLAGLVADLGFVRLAQRQMQFPADASAMEGVRWRDTLTDEERREEARLLMLAHYDDDFFFGGPIDSLQFGAGPDVTLVGGTGSMAANQEIVVGPNLVFEPDPQLNLTNEIHGDMVAGFFNEFATIHAENATTYARNDFTTLSQPPAWRQAFLVRLRRTTGTNPLDADPGVSSRGPTVPYLFARGSLMAADLRSPGVTVRGTAIAADGGVKMAGRPRPDLTPELEGYGPIGFSFAQWTSVPFGPSTLRFSDGDFTLRPAPASPVYVGLERRAPPSLTAWQSTLTQANYGITDLDDIERRFLADLWRPAGLSMTLRVFGFGTVVIRSVEFEDNDNDSVPDDVIVVIDKRPRTVWPLNVSAVVAEDGFVGALGASSPDTAAEITLWNDSVEGVARAAYLAR